MDRATAEHYLRIGLHKLQENRPDHIRRQNYLEGRHDLPYAPEGVSTEYEELRTQSPANWLGIAMGAPVQRLRCDGMRDGKGKLDLDTWNHVWQPNKLNQRSPIVWLQMMTHGRGIWSVSKNPANPKRPIVRVENGERVWVEMDPQDPFTKLFAVKTYQIEDPQSVSSSLVLPEEVRSSIGKLTVAYVYDRTSWMRFEKRGDTFGGGGWVLAAHNAEGAHGLGDVPFVCSDINVNADGVPRGAITEMMPQQDALNTIRFNTLLAMQFSAYRQRVFSGFDPIARDENQNIIFQKDADGKPKVGPNGLPMPVLNTPGRMGVDRGLILPGKDSKVYDLAESNLKNYVEVHSDFLTTLFATGQIPPQYMLTRMANLSGDALAGAESTLQALIGDLQIAAGEGLEEVRRLTCRARGDEEGAEDYAASTVWVDAEARPFSQMVDAITKLVSVGFPRRAAFEMIPGATPTKVNGWMTQLETERNAEQAITGRALRALDGGAQGDADDTDVIDAADRVS